jgi:hypothetical protein
MAARGCISDCPVAHPSRPALGEVIAGLMTAALLQLDEFKLSLGDAVERVLLALLIKDVMGNGFPIVQMPLPDQD